MADTSTTNTLSAATILIIDDTPMNRTVLRLILMQAGGVVREAKSAAEALLRIEQQIPDLILLDVMMPEVDGYEFCEQLRSHPTASQVPIIFISARNDADTKVKAFLLGGADYVTKPFQPPEVVARVKHQIRIARLQRALEEEKTQLIKTNDDLVRSQKQTAAMFGALSEYLPGATFDGKYQIGEVIGTGGFGIVYRALHLGLQRSVALKVFKPSNTAQSEAALVRFRQEGISACRVKHPNAVVVLDSGISREGIPYLVMELLSGRSLNAELANKGPLSLLRCVQIIAPICQVLITAHSTGILHRDIKPDNVFLHQTEDGEVVKVLDFGISKMLGQDGERTRAHQTREGGIIGTPIYMAPERIRGGVQDGRADVYSVGILLFEMMTGQLPFFALDDDLVSMLVEQLTQPPRRLRELRPDISKAVEALVMSALEKDMQARPDMRTFLHQLLQIAKLELGAEQTQDLLTPVQVDDDSTSEVDLAGAETVAAEGGAVFLVKAADGASVDPYDSTKSMPVPEQARQSALRGHSKPL